MRINTKWLSVMALGFSVIFADGADAPSAVTNVVVVQSNSVSSLVATNDAAHQQYVHETISRLMSLQMNNDAASLAAILAEMKNPDKDIRKVALSAVIQFNDRSAVPELQKIADSTQDPFEKVDILKAIDYIKLPSFTEYMAYKRSLKQAKHQTNGLPATPGATTNAPVAPAAHP